MGQSGIADNTATSRTALLAVTWLCACVWVPSVLNAEPAPSPAQTQFAQGLQLADKGDLNGALAVFARMTRDYPRLPEPYAQLAAVYVRQGELLKAIAPLQTAVQLDRDTPALQEQLGDLYVALAKDAYTAATARHTAQSKAAVLQQIDTSPKNKNTNR